MCDRRQDLRIKACEVGIRFGGVQLILTDILGMSKLSARWVSRMLSDDQKKTRLDISRYLLSRYKDYPVNFIERVKAQDATCVHHLDPESKMESKHQKHPGSSFPMKFKMVHTAQKETPQFLGKSMGDHD